jgi:acetyl-CoA synthetase
MGKPSPGYQISLMDANGNFCDVGEEGEIVIKTAEGKPPGLFSGYYREQEKTEKAWYDGYYHTGDTAWMDEDGYLWFVGRNDDMIKSSGYRIGPFEVESAVISHPAVLECAITGVPHPVRGQVVKATVVLTKEYQPTEDLKKEIQNHVKQVTAPYKYPRVVEFVEELPKTISGKIRRIEIREKDQKES